jgi:hypothetical protein
MERAEDCRADCRDKKAGLKPCTTETRALISKKDFIILSELIK